MERSIPIETKVGIINKRDGIFLDHVQSDDHNMTFEGEINGRRLREDFPFTLTFRRVIACFSCELDTYENMGDISYHDSSDFDLIEESTWLQSLPVRQDYDKGSYHHYRLATYDTIYNIIATDYNLEIEIEPEARELIAIRQMAIKTED